MAEFLILTFDTHNPDPELDLFAYKIGHVIDVKPDGHAWGSGETLPKFWIVKVSGMTVEQGQEFLSKLQDLTNPDEPVDIGMRKWKLDYDKLPTNVKAVLNSTGVITVTSSKILDYMTRITI